MKLFDENPYDELPLYYWGRKMLEKAEDIYNKEFKHRQIIDELGRQVFGQDYENRGELGVPNVNFCSRIIGGSYPGPSEIVDYWMKYMFSYSYISLEKKDTIIRIVENLLGIDLLHCDLKTYNPCDFDNEGRFSMTYPNDYYSNLSLTVPSSLDDKSVSFAINVIENITTSKIKDICLWHFSHELSVGSMYSEIEIRVSNHDILKPSITKDQFMSAKFSDGNKWYKEIPAFLDYIKSVEVKSSRH